VGDRFVTDLFCGDVGFWLSDIRADEKNWAKWTETPLNMATMGMAFTMGKLKFKTGDFKAMIKNPSMAGPFVKSFGLMCDISK